MQRSRRRIPSALALAAAVVAIMWKPAIAVDAEMASWDVERQSLEERIAAMTRRVNECDSFMKKSQLKDELNALRQELVKVRQQMHTRGSVLQRSSKYRTAVAAATAAAAAAEIEEAAAGGGGGGGREATGCGLLVTAAASSAIEATVRAKPAIEVAGGDSGAASAATLCASSSPPLSAAGNNDRTLVIRRDDGHVAFALDPATHAAGAAATVSASATGARRADGSGGAALPAAADPEAGIRFFNDASELTSIVGVAVDDGSGGGSGGGSEAAAGVTRSPYEEELAQTLRLLTALTTTVKRMGSTVIADHNGNDGDDDGGDQTRVERGEADSSRAAAATVAQDFFTGAACREAHSTLAAVLDARLHRLRTLRRYWSAGDVESLLS